MTATTSGASHYEILGLDPDATIEDVKKAFNQAAKHLHPDRNGGVELPYYRLAAEARDVLIHPERRMAYDASLNARAPTATPEPDPARDPVWEGEETVDLDDEDPPAATPANDDAVDLDFDINVVADTTDTDASDEGDPSRWARRSVPGEDALPSTPAQRRTWWRLTVVIFLALSAVWWYAAIASQTVRVPSGVADWTTMTVGLGFWWTATAIYTVLCRPLRRLVLVMLAVSTLIAVYIGWGAWEFGHGHTYLPLSPAGAAGLSFLLAVVGRQAWRMHKGRQLEVEEEAVPGE